MTGFVALMIIGVAFGAGRYLDTTLETRGVFTVVFMLGSFPVTLFAMVRLSLMMVARAQARMAELDAKKAKNNDNDIEKKEGSA
ncbi:MAG: hypothetical protein IPM39_00230 [Chloroflexi bacterium]|nr:hypothetical protein [Chloroflexota bacterium]